MCPPGVPLKRDRVLCRTWCTLSRCMCLLSLPQVPFPSTPCAPPTRLPGRVRFWTWMTSCTWGASRKIKLASSSPLRCGRLCSTMATWAASGTCSSTARAKTSGRWPKCRAPREWSPPAPGKQQNRALATLAKTMACAGMGGTDTSVTVPEQATWAGPAREVGSPKPSLWTPLGWKAPYILTWNFTLTVDVYNVCSVEVSSPKRGSHTWQVLDASFMIFKGPGSGRHGFLRILQEYIYGYFVSLIGSEAKQSSRQ